MSARPARLLAGLLALAGAPLLAGCETAPATGRTFFTGGQSAEREPQLGRREHDRIVPRFGGAYDDPALSAYVASIGRRLVQASETPGLDVTFTVLDTPIVNAFALPGGYVHITRGLIALAGDEAELAGVLAHEIGHVTARHSAERYGRQRAAGIAGLGLGLLGGSGALARAVDAGGPVALRGFSREQEYEADLLGIRYLSRAGYDPNAMAGFLAKLRADSRLDGELRGTPGRVDRSNMMSTHPRTTDRIDAALRQAGVPPHRAPQDAADPYLDRIDGLPYGPGPERGVVRGRRFLDPKRRVAFEVPRGFRLVNGPRAVIARGPEGSAIVFGPSARASSLPIALYLTRVWGRGVALEDVQAVTINGMPAAAGQARLTTERGPLDLRFVAIRHDPGAIYRMLFLSPAGRTAALAGAVRDTAGSFRKLGAAEAARIKPLRVRVVTVGPGETVRDLAARMAFEDYRVARFQVLNGLSETAPLRPGQRVKIVAE